MTTGQHEDAHNPGNILLAWTKWGNVMQIWTDTWCERCKSKTEMEWICGVKGRMRLQVCCGSGCEIVLDTGQRQCNVRVECCCLRRERQTGTTIASEGCSKQLPCACWVGMAAMLSFVECCPNPARKRLHKRQTTPRPMTRHPERTVGCPQVVGLHGINVNLARAQSAQ